MTNSFTLCLAPSQPGFNFTISGNSCFPNSQNMTIQCVLDRSLCTSVSCVPQVIWVTGAFAITVTGSLTFVNVTMTGQHFFWKECDADWCTHCMTANYFFDLNGTYVTVIDHHPQLTGQEPYYSASLCSDNANYDLFTVALGANLTFIDCKLTDIRAQFDSFGYLEGSIGFINTDILRMDFSNAFLLSSSNSYVSNTFVLFDHSYVTGLNRDHPLLQTNIFDSYFLYLHGNIDLLIRTSMFEENYELFGTFTVASELLVFSGRYLEITDSVFRYFTGTLDFTCNGPAVGVLIRNVTIDSGFYYFNTVFSINGANINVIISNFRVRNCMGIWFNVIIAISGASLVVLENIEFTNNRMLSNDDVILLLGATTAVMSNCTFTNNGAYSDSFVPYFFYGHLLSLGLINPYPPISDFYQAAANSICNELIAASVGTLLASNLTASCDLEISCDILIDLKAVQVKSSTVVGNFTSVVLSGVSDIGIADTSGSLSNQGIILFTNCTFESLESAISVLYKTLIVNNSTFRNLGTSIQSTQYPIMINSGNAYFQDCSFTNSTGGKSGAVYFNVVDIYSSCVLSIINCLFDNNSVGSGGTDVMVGSTSQTAPMTIEIRDCAFSNPNGVDPSSSLNIQNIFLEDGVIANCTFTTTHGIHMGLILLGPGAGTFSISDILFDSLNATGEDLIYLFQYSTSSVNFVIENLNIRNSAFHSSTRISSSYLKMTSCVFESNTGIVLYNEGGIVEVHDSYFHNTSNPQYACYYQSAYASSAFYGTFFVNNSASQLGLFEIIGPSTSASFQDCHFEGNSLKELAGVVHLTGSPELRIDFCTFLRNFANSNSIFMFERAMLQVLIQNSIFEKNFGSGLLKAVFSTVLMKNVTFTDLDFTQTGYQIMLVSNSNLTLENSNIASIHGLQGFGGCFLSILMGSTAFISSTSISHLQCQQSVITVMLTSSLSLMETTFSNVSSSSKNVINALSGTLLLNNTHFSNISASQGVIFTKQTDVTVGESSFSNVTRGLILYTESCSLLNITSTSFDAITALTDVGVVKSVGCIEVVIQSSNFTNSSATVTAGVQVSSGSVVVTNCLFQRLTAQTHGAIQIEGSSLIISQSIFTDNSAGSTSNSLGGAVYMNTSPNTSISIDGNTFKRNQAIAGGAVYWNSIQSMSALNGSNSYAGNTALYGKNTAYSSFKLRLRNDSLPVLASGQENTWLISIETIDQLGQVDLSDNSTKVLMVLLTGYSLTGSLVATAVQGVFSLSGFVVTSTPGTTANIRIVPNTQNCLSVVLTFQLRNCVIGEIEESNGACVRCSDGTYSLNLNDTSCKNCYPQAICRNGSDIYPLPGYWRPDSLYDGLFQCPNSDACDNKPQPSNVTGICAGGYTGNMCQSCADGYSRSSEDNCIECPSQQDNIIRLSFIGLALFIFIWILVRTALKSANSKLKLTGAFLKILMNYLHLTILIANFDLDWPSVLQDMFNIQGYLGSSGEQFMSLDCTFTQAYFKKLVLVAVLPVALILTNIFIWTLFHILISLHNFSRKLICSFVVSLVYMHPIIVKVALSAFHCITIKPGELWLRNEMDIKCWDHDHSLYTLGAALPSLILWGFGIPTAALFMLIKFRKRLIVLSVKQKIGFLCIGYKEKTFFWEIVIMYRKVGIILLYVFMSSEVVLVQALALCLLLWTAANFQSRLEPFQTRELNRLELQSLLVSIITVYSGMFFSTEALSYSAELTFTTLIIASNAYFLVMWTFFFIRAFIVFFMNNHPRIARFFPFFRTEESVIQPERSHKLPPLMMQLYLNKLQPYIEEVSEQFD